VTSCPKKIALAETALALVEVYDDCSNVLGNSAPVLHPSGSRWEASRRSLYTKQRRSLLRIIMDVYVRFLTPKLHSRFRVVDQS
jgi:hypothetical protein